MSTNISGVGKQNQPIQHHQNVTQTVQAQGAWNGLAVSVKNDPMSLLADAAEEMTFAASETVEKDVADRRKPEKHQKVQVVVPATEEMAQLQHQMAERLAKLLAQAKASMGNPAAFREALDAFPDSTERHAALVWLEEQFKNQPSLADMAVREREKLEAEQAQSIQAGYNLLGLEGDPETGTGTDLYRRTILGHESVSALLESIIQKGGEGDFLSRIDYLMKAVGKDLSSTNPSTDKNELEMMNNDLYNLRALANFTRQFTGDVQKLREQFKLPSLPRSGMEALRLLCRVKDERTVMVDGLKPILGLQGRSSPTFDVRALAGVFKLAHSLPAKLFADQDSRQRVLDAVQTHLDRAVDLEEEVLSQGE